MSNRAGLSLIHTAGYCILCRMYVLAAFQQEDPGRMTYHLSPESCPRGHIEETASLLLYSTRPIRKQVSCLWSSFPPRQKMPFQKSWEINVRGIYYNFLNDVVSTHYIDESTLSAREAKEYKTRCLHPAPTPREIISLVFLMIFTNLQREYTSMTSYKIKPLLCLHVSEQMWEYLNRSQFCTSMPLTD